MVGKLRRTERGELAVRPLIVTDGHRPYYDAFETAIGSDADRAVLIKRYSKLDVNGEPMPSSRYVGSDRIIVSGNPAISKIHTSYIERQNLNLRMGNRRYNRRTNAFSKTLLNHERHLALWLMYHNLCWLPRPMRPRRDEWDVRPRQWIKRTPAAMAAGVTDRLWEVEDLLALSDTYSAARRSIPTSVANAPALVALGDEPPTHWVFRNDLKHSAKVHAATCSNCRDGQGRKAGAGKVGEWLPFQSLDAATEAALTLEPDRTSVCSMCLGSYRTFGRRL